MYVKVQHRTLFTIIFFDWFSQENRADRLWIPESSDYNTHQVENKIDFFKEIKVES